MLAEAKETPIFSRFKQFGRKYVSRCYTSSNHPMVQLLEELSIVVYNFKAQWKKRGKEELHNFYQNTKRTGEKATLKGTTGMARLRDSVRKMNRLAFMSINRMRAGHSCLKASLSRFNIVSTVQCL
jgi:hypothetical protein